ncbi:MAG: TerY-C metal binding domain-containing protein [Phocaeicola sp.]
MRRLPIYFLIDVSESMVGEPIVQMQEGMKTIIQDLRVDPYALESVFVSVIVFAGKAKTVVPLTELFKFYPPTIPIGGGTSLGNAIHCLMDDIDQSVQKTTFESKGDWKPIVFLFTDGNPTDNPTNAFRRWNEKYRSSCNLVVVSIGDNVNTNLFSTLTDNVLRLNHTDEHSFRAFFKWVTASIKMSSISVAEAANDSLVLPASSGINLEKVSADKSYRVDENFAVLLGRCQATKNLYLMKYAKRISALGIEGLEALNTTDFKLIGAYPIDEEIYIALSDETQTGRNINTLDLVGQPTCPCCGNQFAFVVCQCGNIFCVGESMQNRCPWCGLEVILEEGKGMDVNRTRG